MKLKCHLNYGWRKVKVDEKNLKTKKKKVWILAFGSGLGFRVHNTFNLHVSSNVLMHKLLNYCLNSQSIIPLWEWCFNHQFVVLMENIFQIGKKMLHFNYQFVVPINVVFIVSINLPMFWIITHCRSIITCWALYIETNGCMH